MRFIQAALAVYRRVNVNTVVCIINLNDIRLFGGRLFGRVFPHIDIILRKLFCRITRFGG